LRRRDATAIQIHGILRLLARVMIDQNNPAQEKPGRE